MTYQTRQLRRIAELMRQRDTHWRYAQGFRHSARHASRVAEITLELERIAATIPGYRLDVLDYPPEQMSLAPTLQEIMK